MSSPEIPYVQVPAEPTLADLLNQLKKTIFLSMVCHHVGTIQSFDDAKQTATITINYQQSLSLKDAQTGVYRSVLRPYPILTDCPVVVLGGGGGAQGGALTFPIAAGDECLVIFNDRAIDTWFAGTNGQAPPSARTHSISDGIAIVGLRSLNNSLQNYDAQRAVLRNGEALVGVGSSLIKIANNTTTLNNLLQDLVSAVKDLVNATASITVLGVTPGGGASGVPANAAAITAVGSTLTSLGTQISQLLE